MGYAVAKIVDDAIKELVPDCGVTPAHVTERAMQHLKTSMVNGPRLMKADQMYECILLNMISSVKSSGSCLSHVRWPRAFR